MLDWDFMVEALAREAPPTSRGEVGLPRPHLQVAGGRDRVPGLRPAARRLRAGGDRLGHLELDGLHVGCPETERHRVAPLEPAGAAPAASVAAALGGEADRDGLRQVPVRGSVAGQRPAVWWNALVPRGIEDVLWDPAIMDASIPAANGFFTARSLARMYAALAGRGSVAGTRMLSPWTVDKVGQVQNRQPDLVLVFPMHWRLGYHRITISRGPYGPGYGHFGFGGSGVGPIPSTTCRWPWCATGGGHSGGGRPAASTGTAALRSVSGRPSRARSTRRAAGLLSPTRCRALG